MEKANKILRKLHPIIVVIVGLAISHVAYTSKLRGTIEFFVHSLIIILIIIVGRKIYHKS